MRDLSFAAEESQPLRKLISGHGECRQPESERNHTCIRKELHAQSMIPAKRGKKSWHIRGVRAEVRRAFSRLVCRSRAPAETLFSLAKRKLSARALGRWRCARPCFSA